MTYARIFQSGNSQAVRLLKEFRFDNDIVLRQVPTSAAAVFDLLSSLPADFMAEGRQDTPPQEREAF